MKFVTRYFDDSQNDITRIRLWKTHDKIYARGLSIPKLSITEGGVPCPKGLSFHVWYTFSSTEPNTDAAYNRTKFVFCQVLK